MAKQRLESFEVASFEHNQKIPTLGPQKSKQRTIGVEPIGQDCEFQSGARRLQAARQPLKRLEFRVLLGLGRGVNGIFAELRHQGNRDPLRTDQDRFPHVRLIDGVPGFRLFGQGLLE